MAMAYSSGYNMENLKLSLFRKQSQVDEAVIRAVEQGAQKIMEQARKNVPVDTHNLESAIHIKDRRTRRGNHAIDIEVSGIGVDGRDVSEYALIIEEMYDYYVSNGIWQMGEKTKAKQAVSDTHVGSAYMRRAIEKCRPEVINDIRMAIKAAVVR